MGKFRKKPVVIDAEQWFCLADEVEGVEPYPGDLEQPNAVCRHCGGYLKDHGWCSTLEGGHIVCPGDWIITGVKGEKYPCKPDIFGMTYEDVAMDRPETEQPWVREAADPAA